jgi:hypothetical protein
MNADALLDPFMSDSLIIAVAALMSAFHLRLSAFIC